MTDPPMVTLDGVEVSPGDPVWVTATFLRIPCRRPACPELIEMAYHDRGTAIAEMIGTLEDGVAAELRAVAYANERLEDYRRALAVLRRAAED